MKPSLEIFTTRRSSWLTRREDALQADAMPVFPSAEGDTETEAATSRRGSRTAEGQWYGAEGDDADIGENEDDGGFEHYQSDGEDRRGLGGFTRSDPEVRSGGETPRGGGRRLPPGFLVEENTEAETEQDSAVEEPCALGAANQKRMNDGDAGALGLESRSSSGSRGRRQRYQKPEIDHDFSGSMTVPMPSSSAQRSNEQQRET